MHDPYYSFYISFHYFFDIIIHVDSVKRHVPLLRACLFTYFTVYEPCSIQLYIYFSSSVSCACFTIRSGRNVSIITANSSVSFFPILASVFPGCGMGNPARMKCNRTFFHTFATHKVSFYIVKNFITINITMIIWCWN